MGLPLRVEDLPSFADTEPVVGDDPYRRKAWSSFLASIRIKIRKAELGLAERARLTSDTDALLVRIFAKELESIEEYAGIARDLKTQDIAMDQKRAFWEDGSETLAAFQDARKELVRMRGRADVFTSPAVIQYPEDGGVSIGHEAMEVGKPYVFELGGCSHAAVKLEDGSVEFFVLPEPFEGGLDG